MFDKIKNRVFKWLRVIAENLNVLVAKLEGSYTFKDTVKYFVDNRPDIERVRGALLRKRRVIGYELIHLFLNKDDSIVVSDNGALHGFTINVRCLDPELEEFFGDSDLLIFDE